MWAAGTYTCAWGGMAGLPSSLRGLVSEEGLSSGGEAGKEGWLNGNVQDQRRRGLWERGRLIVCELLKKYRVKVTLSFMFSMVPTTRLHGGTLRNEQVPTSWVMTRKKAKQIKEAGVTVEEPGRDQCHKASAAGVSSFQIPPPNPATEPHIRRERSCLGAAQHEDGSVKQTHRLLGEACNPVRHSCAKQKRIWGDF